MKRAIVFRRIAAEEFEQSVAYYESKQAGLGLQFQATVEQTLHRIAEHPEWFPLVRNGVRRAVMARKFPFALHFLIEEQRLVILSVFHASRDPQQLKYR